MTDVPAEGDVYWKFSTDEMFGGWIKYEVVDGGSWPITLRTVPRGDNSSIDETVSEKGWEGKEFADESEVPEDKKY